MPSSMRNAIQRRSHRERAQPFERKRLGLLEKHKDYRLRARDWAKKKATLKNLRAKAAERNEDEFSFKMLGTARRGPGTALTRGSDEKRARHWDGTKAGDRGGRSLSMETVRLLKTQDTGYLRTMRSVAVKEVAQLAQRATMATAQAGDDGDEDNDVDDGPRPKKARRSATTIVFAETAEERDRLLGSQEGDGDGDDADDDDDAKETRKETAARLQRRLATAQQRLNALTAAEAELDLQRARMAKTATVDVVTRKGQRIKMRERKR